MSICAITINSNRLRIFSLIVDLSTIFLHTYICFVYIVGLKEGSEVCGWELGCKGSFENKVGI